MLSPRTAEITGPRSWPRMRSSEPRAPNADIVSPRRDFSPTLRNHLWDYGHGMVPLVAALHMSASRRQTGEALTWDVGELSTHQQYRSRL
jgi:hypothetical protein